MQCVRGSEVGWTSLLVPLVCSTLALFWLVEFVLPCSSHVMRLAYEDC